VGGEEDGAVGDEAREGPPHVAFGEGVHS
jgi:hypothetical protein